MKLLNEDLNKLNKVKFDLLSPPYTFRLSSVATGYVNEAIELMRKYVDEDNFYVHGLNDIRSQIESTADMTEIRKLCKDAAAIVSDFALGK